MEAKWFFSVCNKFSKGKINFENTLELLDKFGIPFDYIHVKYIFKASDSLKLGTITLDDFRGIYRAIVHRHDVHEIFKTHSPNHRILQLPNLVEFLRYEQFQHEADETTASQLIAKFEPIEEGSETPSGGSFQALKALSSILRFPSLYQVKSNQKEQETFNEQ
ncbi:hypothetical protein JRQ81_015400 [Phrynocephalus forsythii]|uniref:phosphoinositide phospholipase C n=1 Tax=Phrynocephalus forsythii TaxID=171643 RepID=A0A9Q1B1E0_9SAUR|nr:hypothetical protein JRQ81_015400 [Phrynocephalus forsythii]